MKRFCLLPILFAMLLLCSCTAVKPSAPAEPAKTPAPTPAPTAVPVEGTSFSVAHVETATATPRYTPSPSPVPVVRIGGRQVPITETALTLTDAAETDLLGEFLDLSFADLSAFTLPLEKAYSLKIAYPETEFAFLVEYCGMTVTKETAELDLRGKEVGSARELNELLTCFDGIGRLDLRGSSLSNEQLGSVQAAHRNTKVVWEVKLADHTLRTDAIGFSTLNPSKYYNEKSSESYIRKVKTTKRLYTKDIDVLRYCPDLVALDLGHNYIDDLSVLEYLPKLQILILADNKIDDISVFAKLPDLVYVEFFMNEVVDISPLAGHDKLLDLNFCNNNVKDLSPLEGMPQLERVWCAGNKFSRAEGKALQEKLPDCKVDYTAKDDTADGWREHERYEWMRAYVKGEHNPA